MDLQVLQHLQEHPHQVVRLRLQVQTVLLVYPQIVVQVVHQHLQVQLVQLVQTVYLN
jgi:hypothetical protein